MISRQGEAESFLANIRGPFDLALLDPPFHHDTVAAVLPLLAAKMAPGGVVLCETEREADLPEQAGSLTLVKQYNYGKIKVSRYERGEEAMNVEELLELMEETLEAGTAVPFAASSAWSTWIVCAISLMRYATISPMKCARARKS